MRPIYVAVCGGSSATDVEAARAREVGRLLAEASAVVVCGGMAGVMAAASRGASEAGGTVIGILPTDRHESANEHVTFSLPTGLGESRNALVARAADAIIAIGGGWGTLSEVALGLQMGLEVIGVETWGLQRMGADVASVRAVRTPEEAVRSAITAAKQRRGSLRSGR